MTDFYSTLGVSKTATADEIKTAFRQLAKQWHPDRNDSPDAKEKFQAINEAYQTLSDPAKKQKYDNPQPTSNGFGGFGFPFDHAFADILRRAGAGQANAHVYTVQQVTISLEQAYAGGQRIINGSTVKFPAGVRHGSMFQTNGQHYSIRIMPHAKYNIVNNNDLTCAIEISTLDALLGTSIILTHLDGNKLEFDIPEHTQHEQIIRIVGKGMPLPEQNGKFGNLFIICSLITPTDLTEDQKAYILNVYPKRTQEF